MKSISVYMKQWVKLLIQFIRTLFMNRAAMTAEILALRSQLALFEEQVIHKKRKKPKTNHAFRQLWVLLSKFIANWKSYLIVVKPETVIGWHRTAFRFYWKRKSKKVGRPQIPVDIIKKIKRIHEENPLLSPEKIREMLISMGVIDPPAPNTIAKYLPTTRKPPSEKQVQSWKTFLKNHSRKIWAMDYFVVPDLKFRPLYVLMIINHGTRKIEHFAVSTNPNLEWVKQQIRNAMPFDHKPKYLIHDNDHVFVCNAFQKFLNNIGVVSKRTAFYSPWQNGIAERANGIIRQELTNHIIPINENHLSRLLKEYIHDYYNTHRTHQGINCKTPIPLPEYKSTILANTKLEATPVLNGMYHTYNKVA